eukprot:767549-Pyramimonas_sp.AAC.1
MKRRTGGRRGRPRSRPRGQRRAMAKKRPSARSWNSCRSSKQLEKLERLKSCVIRSCNSRS